MDGISAVQMEIEDIKDGVEAKQKIIKLAEMRVMAKNNKLDTLKNYNFYVPNITDFKQERVLERKS
jgi:hypothetical protein